MAFSSIGTLGSTTEKTSDTDLVLTVEATAEAGNLVAVFASMDNESGTTGESTQLSISDSTGSNTWTKLVEMTRSSGSANDGVVIAVWVSKLTSQLTGSSSTITITSSSARSAKAMGAWEFSMGSGSIGFGDVQGTDYEVAHGANTTEPAAVSISGLTSREYLLFHVIGEEGGTTHTPDADYTEMFDAVETTGGATTSNTSLFASYRIATLTGDTADAASTGDREHAQILAAIYEITGATESLAATPAGVATVTAALSEDVQLAASPAGVATVTADLGEDVALAATPAGVAAVSADLGLRVPLEATCEGMASITADLSGTDVSIENLAASVTGVATVSGDVSLFDTLAASCAGVGTVSADLSERASLAATVAGVAVVLGDLTAREGLEAQVLGIATLSASLSGTEEEVALARLRMVMRLGQ